MQLTTLYALLQLLTLSAHTTYSKKNLQEENFNESVHKTIAKEDEIILCNESITSL